MIIGITGYGATGASAYIDLLREFENVQAYGASFEFQLLQQPDGINDLRYFLVDAKRRLNTNAAISRFIRNIGSSCSLKINRATDGNYDKLAHEYINSLIKVSWNGESTYDPKDVAGLLSADAFIYPNKAIRFLVHKINKNISWPPKRYRYFSYIEEDEFIAITRIYLKRILKASGFDIDKPIILEQLFSCSNPLAGYEYFDDVRSLIVDRDPRDIYCLVSKFYPHLCGFMPHDNVDDFIRYYRSLHTRRVNDYRVMYVRFEDIVYHYDITVKELINWLGLKHVNIKTRFKPEYSIANTMVYKRYPELKQEISIIEKELSDFLYDFDSAFNEIDYVPSNTELFDKQIDAERRYSKRHK